jgi:hypothetical protein
MADAEATPLHILTGETVKDFFVGLAVILLFPIWFPFLAILFLCEGIASIGRDFSASRREPPR